MAYDNVQKHPRVMVTAPVDVRFSRDHVEILSTRNISLGGMFLRCNTLVPRDTQLLLRMKTPQGSFTTSARVVHVIDEDLAAKKNHPSGLGIRFDSLSVYAETALRRHIATLMHVTAVPLGTAAEIRPHGDVHGWRRRTWTQVVETGSLLRFALQRAYESFKVRSGEDHADSTHDLAWYHDRLEKLRTAQDELEAANNIDDPLLQQIRDLMRMASEHEQRGDFDEARQVLKTANELYRNHPAVLAALDLLEDVENKRSALI